MLLNRVISYFGLVLLPINIALTYGLVTGGLSVVLRYLKGRKNFLQIQEEVIRQLEW